MRDGTSSIEVLQLLTDSEHRAQLERDALAGLTSSPKWLPPKYFYDARGSQLFEEITKLPEYYPTRSETALLERYANELFEGEGTEELVEIGSGSSRKTRLLLAAFEHAGGRRYVPVDVSEDALIDALAHLSASFGGLELLGVVADFERHLDQIPRTGRRLVAFLGSTIGNLAAEERVQFLRQVRGMLEEGDRFLLGIDLIKPVERLEAAYNDSQGVTAAFNLNVIQVLNRELGGDLPADCFLHRAFYDPELERIEMRLVASRDVHARLGALELELDFEAGEEMQTEISCKFRRETLVSALEQAGMSLERWLTDSSGDFALALARPAGTTG